MKCLMYTLLLTIFGLSANAQIETFGEVGLSLGTGRYLRNSAGGAQLGGTMHCMAGAQYGVFALNAGLGLIILSDEVEFSEIQLKAGRFDFPVGAAVRFPLDNVVIAIGADISGFLGGDNDLLLQPHIDVLFNGARWSRGFFFKGVTNLKDGSPSYQPQYFGVGFKATFG
jgi:hypothetical protein